MDPMTFAAKRFLTQLEGSWNPSPTLPGLRVVRLIVNPAERGDLIKTLRWLEWSPDNRHPIVLFEDAFEDEIRWLRGLVAKTADDCGAVRKGLTEDGNPLTPPPTSPAEGVIDAVAARRYLDAVAERMAGGPLEGLFVALVPAHVTDPKVYRSTVATIAAAPSSAFLRVAVLDVPGADLGALLPSEARFEVDPAELFAYLKQMGAKPSKGPAMPKLPSPSTPDLLRALLLDAGQALAEGEGKLAVKHFGAAQALARANGLMEQECTIGIGLGGAQLAAGDEQAAVTTFQHVTQCALAAKLSPVAAQAMLGIAGVHFGKGRYAVARAAYDFLACGAVDIPALAEEAERMQQQCRELEGMPSEEAPTVRSRKEMAIAH